MFRGGGCDVGQGQFKRLPRETKAEAQVLLKGTVHFLFLGTHGQLKLPGVPEVGEVLLLCAATVSTTDGPPGHRLLTVPTHELSLMLQPVHQQVLLALSLKYNWSLTTS